MRPVAGSPGHAGGGRMARTAPGDRPCVDPDRICCGRWREMACRSPSVAERLAHIAWAGENTPGDEIICTLQAAEAAPTGGNAAKEDAACTLRAMEAALVEDNNPCKANKDPNAGANGIRTKESEGAPAADPRQPGRGGRPPGRRVAVDRTHQKTHGTMLNGFCGRPECGKGNVSGVVDWYYRVVETERAMTENVEIRTVRRYCRDCKKPVSGDVPGVAPCARVSANKSAAMASLNMA